MSPAPAQQTILGRKNRACVITQAVRASAMILVFRLLRQEGETAFVSIFAFLTPPV